MGPIRPLTPARVFSHAIWYMFDESRFLRSLAPPLLLRVHDILACVHEDIVQLSCTYQVCYDGSKLAGTC
jgi:hypothetical protein